MVAILINHRLFAVTIDGLRRDVAIGLMLDRLLHEHASQFQPNLHSLTFDLGKPSAPFRARLFAIVPATNISHDTNHPPHQPTCPRVTSICRLLILTFLNVEDHIQTLSRTQLCRTALRDLDPFSHPAV